jgi:iron complex outermembrane recepter protein
MHAIRVVARKEHRGILSAGFAGSLFQNPRTQWAMDSAKWRGRQIAPLLTTFIDCHQHLVSGVSMFHRTKVSRALLLAFGGGIVLSGAGALAQDAAAPAPAAAAPQRVEVTGSRIRSLNADSPSPIQVISAEDIAASGVTNIQELLLKIPNTGTPTISRTNSNFQTSSVGISTIDLRNLGEARTLVLVNGRRYVAGVPGDTAVDLNTIPVQFVERVEIITGGQSSVYGSDAVAGVVNFILKKDFEGVELDVKYGESSRGDDRRREANITFGTNSANGRANLMGHIAVSKQGGVFSRDREASAVDQTSLGPLIFDSDNPQDFDPATLFQAVRPFYSSFVPQGRFASDFDPLTGIAGFNVTYDQAGNLIPPSVNGPNGDGVGATGFNRSDFRTIAVPTNRALFAAKGNYEFAENQSVFFEGTYAGTKTTAELEPFGLDAIDIYPATGLVPAEFLVNGSLVRNPVIPDNVFSGLTDNDGDGIRDYFFARRLSEVGNRGAAADRDMFRILTGARGTITGTWEYEAYGAYGSTKEAQVSGGQVNVLNFRNALQAISDPVTGEPICLDAEARAQGCVPIDLFGFGSISPAALKYVQAPTLLNTLTTQKLVGASVTGEALQLPAGPMGVVFGAEYRKEFARSEFDALTQAGLNAGNAIPKTEGSFDVTELFAEVNVPILKDSPGAKLLEFGGAVRGGDYSTVGNTTSWNANLKWEPVADVRVRATNSVSTRAPNINELFSPPSQTFPADLVDPCEGVTLTSTTPQSEGCRADPGVLRNIQVNGEFTLNQPDRQGISGFDRGNPLLNDEKGKSWTFGLSFTPRTSFGRLNISADYFKIEIDDAIVPTPRQFILDQCYSGDPSFCQFIDRRQAATGQNSAGSIEFIDSAVTNSGGLVSEGIDLTFGISAKLGPGEISSQLTWTHMLQDYIVPLPGADRDQRKGEVGFAKDKALLTIGYDWGDFGITSSTTYIGASALDDQFLAGFGLAPGSVKVKEKFYNDFQFTYAPTKSSELYLGIQNAFDTKAPPIISGLPGSNTGAETDAGTYDAIGRRWYVGIRIKL